MIVKCEQCQTRFKIPDDKVTEKGVKVRCTKCQHTFRVTRDGQPVAPASAPAAAAPFAAPPSDPFAAFGTAASVAHEEATRPGMMRPPLPAAAPPASDPFGEDAPTRVGPLPNLNMLRPPKGPLGLSAPHSPAPHAGQPASNPFAFALGSAPLPATRQQPAVTSEFTQPAAPAWGGDNPFGGAPADPFASFGTPAAPSNAVTVTQPALRAPPPAAQPSEAWTQPQPAYPAPPAPFSSPAAAAPSWDAATFTGALPTTQKNPAFVPQSAVPAPPPAGQWDFAATPGAASPQASPFDFSASAPESEPQAAGWGDLGAAGAADPFGAASAPAPQGGGYQVPASGSAPADMFAPPGGSMPQAAGPYQDSTFNDPAGQAAAPVETQLPSFEEQGFGSELSAPMPEVPSHFSGDGGNDASSLFGATGASLSGDGESLPPRPASEGPSKPMARIDLARKTTGEIQAEQAQDAAAAAASAAATAAASAAAEARPELPPEPMPPPRGSVAGIVANISVAAVLLLVLLGLGTAYFNEGKLDASALSWSRVGEYFSARHDFVPVDLSNGLYDTRGGHPVFFVRGEVINHSGKETRVSVRAEIFDGDQLVRSAQGWAGATPSLEDLNAITAAADVDRLNEKLGAMAKPLPVGANGSFLVPFYEYPADLKGIRVKVVLSDAEPPRAAAR